MDEFNEYLDNLLSSQENAELEFKHAHGGFPGNFWETYSAFANTNGGLIMFGVKEHNGIFTPDLIDDSLTDTLLKTFWEQVRSKDSISLGLLSNNDVKVIKYGKNNIILFNIPRAPISDRPVYVGRDPMTGSYRRGHEGDYRCTPSEVRQMFADANIEVPADSRLLENFGMDDIDIDTINQYRQRMAVANPDHVWLSLDNKQLLQKLGGYRVDRRTKKEGLTVAGLLMFGKWSSIRDVDGMPNYGVDYREYTAYSERWSHRIFSDGSWEANLFQFFYRVLPRLHNVIDTPFRLEGSTRIDQKPAHKSIREALVNCIIHTTYGSIARIVVNCYPNEIVFSNPGTMLVSQRQFFTGGQSVCRNQSLQVMFSLLGVGDQAGSGGDVILHGWQEENLRTPYIIESDRPDKVELFMPLESIFSKKIKNELTERFGEGINNLDHNSLTILATAVSEDVTNERLQYIIDAHRADITLLLRELCRNGYLEAYGIGRGTHYKLARFDKAKDKAKDKVKDKAGARRKKEIAIKELSLYCGTWRKSSEMARHVGEEFQYISRRIIPEMLRRGILVREYPDIPTHPAQRYKIKPNGEI